WLRALVSNRGLFCLATENRTQDTGHVSISGPQPICAKSRALSDNRSNSRDSRYHLDDDNNGLVPYDDIQGVALFRFWPFTRIGLLN
ncbi:S26 family signal peptidase, partial [Bifidobacterium longum]|uniref:S26 family signal peptidase n=1 Tax=Bifidobacterium longum TaxID=216816 RepID=UPI001F244389